MSTRNHNLLGYACMGLGISTLLACHFSGRVSRKVIKEQSKEEEATFPAEIQDELLSRVKTFFGENGLEKIKNSFIVVRLCSLYR
jgi:hypothetical protein